MRFAFSSFRCGAVAAMLAAAPLAAHAQAHPGARAHAHPAVQLPVVTYAAPSGAMPAGHLRGATYDAVLPSGRIVTPAGTSVVTGMNALGVALTPDGRFAIVSDDDEREARVRSMVDSDATGGFNLAVVDVASMRVVDRYHAATPERFWIGVAAVPDPVDPAHTLVLASGGPSNAVYAFQLDGAGRLTPDAHHVITPPVPNDPAFADAGRSSPGAIAVARDGRRAYVVNAMADTVSAIDLATRTISGPAQPVGYCPSGVALDGDRLLVTNEGLMRYAALEQPATTPRFAPVASDMAHASSLSFVALAPSGDLSAAPADVPPYANLPLPLDPTPDGLRTVGGAHPTAIVTTADGAYAFVAMTNVDRIATIALRGAPRAVGGTELRLFDRGPFGTQPAALALSHDGSRLYVALAGLNAVAVIDARDPVHLHRLGLIPTGWYPTALALASDDRTLYVVNTKGYGHDEGFTGDPDNGADANATWSTLQKIDLASVGLKSTTLTTLANTRRVTSARPAYPRAITHVVVILQASKTFDAVLGDLGAPAGDPAMAAFGATVTPNLHALAQRYGLAANLYADAEESGAGHAFADDGIATLYSERMALAGSGQARLGSAREDPEDAPRLGSVFDALARHRIAFRDYGESLRVSGYDAGVASDARGLGGVYRFNVPAAPALAGHVDLEYPAWNPSIGDDARATEFLRDYGALVAQGRQPRFTFVSLPGDHAVAEGDRALGRIVAYLSRLPSWQHTALFVMPSDAQGSRDHVDTYRTYAIVAGPYAKRHYVGMRHLSTVSVLKTTEQILGLGTLSLGDLLATDMSDFFTPSGGDAAPYDAIGATLPDR